jgi:hypothetical protein
MQIQIQDMVFQTNAEQAPGIKLPYFSFSNSFGSGLASSGSDPKYLLFLQKYEMILNTFLMAF